MPDDTCAIDFGTSNSAIARVTPHGAALVALEGGAATMPTAVFYAAEGDPDRLYGRAALAAYIDGLDGRLMRSMKSVLGSTFADQATDVGAGRSVRYVDVLAGYLRHLKQCAESDGAAPLRRVVLGRPVFFVDDDPHRDAVAQATLEDAAQRIGFEDVRFQFEPIAAALDYERQVEREQIVLVADIGGGTSDFSVVRVGPGRRARADRRDDILANHGVHVAGTDFDRHLELDCILPWCGYRGATPDQPPREVPSGVYFDLATWHLINTVYTAPRVAELRRMRDFYADPRQHRRLMRVVDERLGHELAALAESAKIAVADHGRARIDGHLIEPGLAAELDASRAFAAMGADLQRVVDAAVEALRQAGLPPDAIDALYFTGGSTALAPLADGIAARFPTARAVRGDRFASVAKGLGLHAQRVFGPVGP